MLKGPKLIKFIKLVHKKNLLMNNLEKRGMPRLLTKKLVETIDSENDFQDKDKAKAIAQKLLEGLACARTWRSSSTRNTGRIRWISNSRLNGVNTHKIIDHDFLTGPEFSDIKELYGKLDELPVRPLFHRDRQGKFPCGQPQGTGDVPVRTAAKRAYPSSVTKDSAK